MGYREGLGEGFGDVSEGALDWTSLGRLEGCRVLHLVGERASSASEYCDLAEVPHKSLTLSSPPTGVARGESAVTTTPKTTIALDREAGAVFMIRSMPLTSGSEFSSCREHAEDMRAINAFFSLCLDRCWEAARWLYDAVCVQAACSLP